MMDNIIKLSERNNKVLANSLKLGFPVTVTRKPKQPKLNKANIEAYLCAQMPSKA